MPIALRDAEILRDGRLASGIGTLSSGSGALDQTDATRALRTERPDRKISLERLIAAAQTERAARSGGPQPTGILIAIVCALVWAGKRVRR